MQDIVVTGRKYRVLKDKKLKIWKVISWWTHAKDVEFADGTNLQDTFGGVQKVVDVNADSHTTIPTSHAVFTAIKSVKDTLDNVAKNVTNTATNIRDMLTVRHRYVSEDSTKIDRDELLYPLDFAENTMNKVGNTAFFGDGGGGHGVQSESENKREEGLFYIKGISTMSSDKETGIGMITARSKSSKASDKWAEVGKILYDGEKFIFTQSIEAKNIQDLEEAVKNLIGLDHKADDTTYKTKSVFGLNERLTQLETNVVKAETVSGIKDEYNAILNAIGNKTDTDGNSIYGNIHSMKDDIDKIQNSQTKLSLTTLNSAISSVSSSISSLDSKLKAQEQGITHNQSSISTNATNIQACIDHIKSLETEMKSLTQKLNKANGKNVPSITAWTPNNW